LTTSLEDIRAAIGAFTPALIPDSVDMQAAVALVLREDETDVQVLFIERAAHDSDPWSGDIGFPGGRAEPGDAGLQSTAERETLEEVGIALSEAEFFGRLSDIGGGRLHVRVSCFIYALRAAGPLTLSLEVRDAFWVPLRKLLDPARHGEATVRYGAEAMTRPAIRLPQPDKPVLWGLTYRLVMQFLEIVQKEGLSGPRRDSDESGRL
jgi:8-oxo-dGTP pyrophosphatase MutT (NUDIX family)